MSDSELKLAQKRSLKTSRIPIKVVPSEPLRKPEWIRVRAGGGERFNEIKAIEVKELIRSLLEDRHFYPGFREAAQVQAVVDAMLLSSRERRWVKVSEIQTR